MRARTVGEKAHAAEQVAVRDARRRHDDLARRQILGAEDSGVVLDPDRAQLLDLAARSRPELRLQLAPEAAQGGRREHGLSGAADADREMVIGAADRRRDRGGYVTVLDQLDARARTADLLDQVMMARPVEDDGRDVVHSPAECLGDRLHVLGDRAQEVDRPPGPRSDGELSHVHVRQRQQPPRLAHRDHRHRPVAASRDHAAAFERVEREIDVDAARAEDHAGREPALVADRAEDNTPTDRQEVERDAHPVGSRFLRALLVGSPEPPRRAKRRMLGRPQERLALARLRVSSLGLLDLAVGHTFSRARSAADRTNSATAAVARSADSFSITGTPSRSARSTM